MLGRYSVCGIVRPLVGSFLREKRKYILGGRAYYEPLEWLWAPPVPRAQSDPTTGWNDNEKRVGLIGKKIGMITEYDDWGNVMPITCIEVQKNYVIQAKTMEKEKYVALQVGTGVRKAKNTTIQLRGHFEKAGVPYCQRITEFRVTKNALLPIGTELTIHHFMPGQFLDIQGVSIGKGFQGGMKRWGFHGFPNSHGTSLAHRSIGSTGSCQDPGKVWKGKKMAGQMGNKKRTVKNLVLWKVDTEQNVLLIRGPVVGPDGSWVRIMDAKNKKHPKPPPFPTHIATGDEPNDVIKGKIPMPYETRLHSCYPPSIVNETVWDTQKRLAKKSMDKFRKEEEERIANLVPSEWVVFDGIEKAHEDFENENERLETIELKE
jgi:large subunit ribosomal protein L3